MFLQGLVSSVGRPYSRSLTALSRYCAIPVVVEPQSIWVFRPDAFFAANVYSVHVLRAESIGERPGER